MSEPKLACLRSGLVGALLSKQYDSVVQNILLNLIIQFSASAIIAQLTAAISGRN